MNYINQYDYENEQKFYETKALHSFYDFLMNYNKLDKFHRDELFIAILSLVSEEQQKQSNKII